MITTREVTYAPADGQDRILSATQTLPLQTPQSVTWTYSANGELQTNTIAGATTTYAYDARCERPYCLTPRGSTT